MSGRPSRSAGCDPDRPLLRLLNRVAGGPVLVVCGRPGNHDAAHAAAGRLPVRFHRFSDLRLFWREFPGCDRRFDRMRRFAGAVALTNAAEPFADVTAAAVLARFEGARVWGEADPGGAVRWREDFTIVPVEDRRGRRLDLWRLRAKFDQGGGDGG